MVAVDGIPFRFSHLINAHIIVCAFLVTFCSPEECKKKTVCSCQTSRMTLDLSKIVNPDPTQPLFKDLPTTRPTQDKNRYSYSPCVAFSEGTGVFSCTGQAACQKIPATPPLLDQYYGLGSPASSVFHGDPAADMFYISYNLTSGTQKVTRTALVNVSCSSDDGKLEVLGEGPPTYYKFILHTRHVCLPGGLSVGSILLIVLFVLVLAYIIGGILFLRFVQGARGTEQFPNLEFWKDFPFLVRDGVQFTITGCKGENTYEKI